jgi:tRNA pseudouridine13 synthase
MTIVLKKIPEDFRVRETQTIHNLSGSGSGPFRHFSVRKKNYETFDVVAALSSHYGIARQDITFSGLKDKDGVTEQYVCVRCGDGNGISPEEFNEKYYESDSAERFIHIRDAGPSNHELVVADLLGNTFDMVVRSIDPALHEKLDAHDSTDFIFINYYDVQRFGVPGGAKITHRIGEALEAEDYEQAIALINRVGDSDDIAGNPIAHRDELFTRLDKRKIAFYLSSYSSFRWNASLQSMLTSGVAGDDLIREDVEGVPYVYPRDIRAALPVVCRGNPYRYVRHVVKADRVVAVETSRPEFIQVIIRIGKPERDEYHPGKLKCRFSFFLPSGCYATMALKQFMIQLEQA